MYFKYSLCTLKPGENHHPAASHWQTLSHNVASSTPCRGGIQTHNVSGDRQLPYDPVNLLKQIRVCSYPVLNWCFFQCISNNCAPLITPSYLGPSWLWCTFYYEGVRVMVFNATFNNISVILWLSVLLMEETWIHRENHWPVSQYNWNIVESGVKHHNPHP
jgi:quinol-cytochrome oxidoreductase complex cytochrome b subunit